MNAKLDHLFRFRDNEKFKKFVKYFTYIVLTYTFVVLVMTTVASISKNVSSNPFTIHKAWAFSVIPLLLMLSFFRKNDYLFILAEFITVIADIFLMMLGNRAVGFPVYILVQLAYGAYFFFRDPNRKRQIIITIIRPVAMALFTVILYVVGKSLFKLTNVFGVFYFVNIIINVICACLMKDPILIVGFSLFALSDSFIALGIIAPKGSAFKNFLNSFNFVHFFYLISQPILVFNKYNNVYSRKILHK